MYTYLLLECRSGERSDTRRKKTSIIVIVFLSHELDYQQQQYPPLHF